MSGKRCKALKREFYVLNGRSSRKAKWVGGKLIQNSEWRKFKRSA